MFYLFNPSSCWQTFELFPVYCGNISTNLFVSMTSLLSGQFLDQHLTHTMHVHLESSWEATLFKLLPASHSSVPGAAHRPRPLLPFTFHPVTPWNSNFPQPRQYPPRWPICRCLRCPVLANLWPLITAFTWNSFPALWHSLLASQF